MIRLVWNGILGGRVWWQLALDITSKLGWWLTTISISCCPDIDWPQTLNPKHLHLYIFLKCWTQKRPLILFGIVRYRLATVGPRGGIFKDFHWFAWHTLLPPGSCSKATINRKNRICLIIMDGMQGTNNRLFTHLTTVSNSWHHSMSRDHTSGDQTSPFDIWESTWGGVQSTRMHCETIQ